MKHARQKVDSGFWNKTPGDEEVVPFNWGVLLVKESALPGGRMMPLGAPSPILSTENALSR